MEEQQKILDAIHDHDKRLVKVETELHGLHREVGTLSAHITRLADYVAEIRGSQKWVFWIVTVGIPSLLAVGIWDRLFA